MGRQTVLPASKWDCVFWLMSKKSVTTVGYGNLELPAFLTLILDQSVEVVCDVRSTPYSTYNQSFGRESLQVSLKDVGVRYLYLGDLLGARPSDPDLYVNGRASYEAMATSSQFLQGVERLQAGMESYRISTMCAEKDPIDCHRAILIAPLLRKDGSEVNHICADGSVESDDNLRRRLLNRYGLEQTSLFEDSADEAALRVAYARRGAELAYDIEAAYRARIRR